MPTSRKGRRSQAWRTFIRNHAITIVQSHSFDSHNWARDLLSQVRYRSRIFTSHLSAFVIAPVTGPSCLVVWHTVHPLLVAVAHPRVQFTRNSNSDCQIYSLDASMPAGGSQGRSFDDRSNSRPARRATAEASRGPLINALTWQARAFTRPTQRHSTASSTNCPYSQTAIGALECHPRPGS